MTQIADTSSKENAAAYTNDVKVNRTWFMVLGIMMILLGGAAIVFPFVATLAMELFIGWALVIIGAMGIVSAFQAAKWKGFLLSMLSALLALGIGVLLLLFPLPGILSLTLLVAAYLIVSGILRIFLAFRLRPLDHWGWHLIGGSLALVLAVLILAQWPEAAAWIIGLLIGVDLIFSGWTLIMLAVATRHMAQPNAKGLDSDRDEVTS
jgi:uncharacterized membrane protein HdeD (DUF308 family)